jgi:hypothetical protein
MEEIDKEGEEAYTFSFTKYQHPLVKMLFYLLLFLPHQGALGMKMLCEKHERLRDLKLYL